MSKNRPTTSDLPLPSLAPLLKANPKTFKNRLALNVNEFFLIEALLRSNGAKQAYRRGGEQELSRFLRSHGIFFQTPLKSSHHSLLKEDPRETEEAYETIGLIDCHLGIQDLGVTAKVYGGKACLAMIENTSPRFICLRFDMAHPAGSILKSKKLRQLLQQKHESAKRVKNPTIRVLQRSSSNPGGQPKVIYEGPLFASIDRMTRWTRFKDIPAWLQYLQVWDRYDASDRTKNDKKAIAADMYPDVTNPVEKVDSALKEVRLAIKSALDGTWPPTTKRENS